MGHIINTVASVAALTALFISEVAAQSCPGVNSRFQPRMGSGYRFSLLATGLRQPRHITIDSAGNLLVAEGGSQSVRRLVLQDQGNIVCVQSNTQLSGTNVSHPHCKQDGYEGGADKEGDRPTMVLLFLLMAGHSSRPTWPR